MWQGHNFDQHWKKNFLQDPVVKNWYQHPKTAVKRPQFWSTLKTKLLDTDTKTLKVKQLPKTLRPGLQTPILYGKNFPECAEHFDKLFVKLGQSRPTAGKA